MQFTSIRSRTSLPFQCTEQLTYAYFHEGDSVDFQDSLDLRVNFFKGRRRDAPLEIGHAGEQVRSNEKGSQLQLPQVWLIRGLQARRGAPISIKNTYCEVNQSC